LQHAAEKIILCPQEHISLKHIFGEHNQKNATLIAQLAVQAFEIPHTEILSAMESFSGLRRRMEYIATLPSGAILYSDYGHHPTEVDSVFEAMREKYPTHSLSIIFQPHQARRVLQFRDQFVSVISKFNERLIFNIYAARENLDELLDTFPSSHTIDITTIDELGDAFASDCKSPYAVNYEVVSHAIKSAKPNTIICICSA
jgi:UDP-N-acetylmuramate-alanine ligase